MRPDGATRLSGAVKVAVRAGAPSPDGRLLARRDGVGDNPVTVVDLSTGALIRRFDETAQMGLTARWFGADRAGIDSQFHHMILPLKGAPSGNFNVSLLENIPGTGNFVANEENPEYADMPASVSAMPDGARKMVAKLAWLAAARRAGKKEEPRFPGLVLLYGGPEHREPVQFAPLPTATGTAASPLDIRGRGYFHAIAVSADGRRVAGAASETLDASDTSATSVTDPDPNVVGVWDTATLTLKTRLASRVANLSSLALSLDGRRLFTVADDGVGVWDSDTGERVATFPVAKYALFVRPVARTGRYAAFSINGEIDIFDPQAKDARFTAIASPRLVDGGALSNKPVVWSCDEDGVIRFWSALDGRLLLTYRLLDDTRFIVFSPDGRYDTNTAADTPAIRWLVLDAPLQSLAPQTFMRDFYLPGLVGKTLDCVGSRDPAALHPAVPTVARSAHAQSDLAGRRHRQRSSKRPRWERPRRRQSQRRRRS